MKEDLIGGLKNALERGETISEAQESFIRAGYSESEVREAASMISDGAIMIQQSQNTQIKSSFIYELLLHFA